MRAKTCALLMLGLLSFSHVAGSKECRDPHTKALNLMFIEGLRTYPNDVVTPETVQWFRAIIDRAVRPADAGIRKRACETLVLIMYRDYGLDELRRQSDVYAGCPDDTVDNVLARAQPKDSDDGVDDYLPIVRVAPVYPRRALDNGLSGSVTIEFTVTKKGRVKRPRVVESTDSVFDKAAIEAVRKFRYKPRVENGIAVAAPGVVVRMTFRHPDDPDANPCPDYGPPRLLPDDELARLSLESSD